MAPSILTRLIESQLSSIDQLDYSNWHKTANKLRACAYAGVGGALGLEAARQGRISQSMDVRGPECILEMANTILVEASNAFHAEHLKDKVPLNCS